MKKIAVLIPGLLLSSNIGLIAVSCPVSPLNTVNNGRIIKGGTYYNTVGNKTTFVNSQSGGLWLKAGAAVRGLEVKANGALNTNGGTLHLYAPGNVVRIDGTLNVNALQNGQGAYLGKGGQVYIDSAYLFHNGNIFANGRQGGLVQANVGAMTMGPGAQITAKGSDGAGGAVIVNSPGPVDLRCLSVIDTSGRVTGNFDGNLINIEGSLVHSDGVLRANGTLADFGGSRGGVIRLIATAQSDFQDLRDSLQAAAFNPAGDTSSPTISSNERAFLIQRGNALIQNEDGMVTLGSTNSTKPYTATLRADGTPGVYDPNNDPASKISRMGDGGTIILSSTNGVRNFGEIHANGAPGVFRTTRGNGGYGGTVVLTAEYGAAYNAGLIEASGGAGGDALSGTTVKGGNGGYGGLLAFSGKGGDTNNGIIQANGGKGGNGMIAGYGGNGGLVVHSSFSSLWGTGHLNVNGGMGGNGSSTSLNGRAGLFVDSDRFSEHPEAQAAEILTHGDNLLVLTRLGPGPLSRNLFDNINEGRVRSVNDPTGMLGLAEKELFLKNGLHSGYQYHNLLASTIADFLDINLEPPKMASNRLSAVPFTQLNTLTVSNDYSISVRTQPQAGPDSFWVLGQNRNLFSGAHISVLAGDFLSSNEFGTTEGVYSGGSINIASGGSLYHSQIPNTSTQFLPSRIYTSGNRHGGSVILKAQENIRLDYPGSDRQSFVMSNGRQMGGMISLLAKRDLVYSEGHVVEANARQQGGILNIKAGNNLYGRGSFYANGFGGSDGDNEFDGQGGYIRMHADNSFMNSGFDPNAGIIAANGGKFGGTVVLTAGDRIQGNEGRVGLPDSPPFLEPVLGFRALTPPVTNVITSANTQPSESFYNIGGIIQTVGSQKDGSIYLGGNTQVLLSRAETVLQNVNLNPNSYNAIVNSSNPNQAFQTFFKGVQANGGHTYVVAGQQLQNAAGSVRPAVQVIDAEAAPNGAKPDVNPTQNVPQGSEFPDDFQLSPIP